MKEFQLIEKFLKPLTKNHRAAGELKDDIAQISDLVISKDMFVEDVHFLRSDGGFKIASKLLRTNLSDLASVGSTPAYYMLGLAKNKNIDEKFLRDFARGLKSVQDEFKLSLIGGDTVSSDKLFFSITIFGRAKKGKTLSRSAAKDGDLIYVSGKIGEAFLGRTTRKSKKFLDRHFFPSPRIELGKNLLEKNLSKCAIDVSDGLLADLKHLCEASKLAAEINLEQIPLPKLSNENPLDLISAGDDYELIFSINPRNQKKISILSKQMGLDLTCIGKFTAAKKQDITLRKEGKKIMIKKLGYEH